MRFKIKNLTAILLAAALLFCAACSQGGTVPTAEETSAPQARTVTDNAGKTVALPAQIERVVIISTLPLASVYCMVAKGEQKLVGLTPASKNAALNSFIMELAPEIAEVETEFAAGETVNVESVLGLSPDMVLYNTNNAADSEAAASLTEAGIACVGFSPVAQGGNTIETFNAWVSLLGEVLGGDLQANAIVSYGRETQDLVAERISEIPEAERKTALILANYTEAAIVAAGAPFGRYWLAAIGAVNVAADIEQTMSPVNLEQIYEWDPDVIFLNSFSAFTADEILNGAAVAGQDWSGLKAVQSGGVYKMPLGMYYWFPPCSDSPLALLWLAKNLYPERFEDVDMDKTIRDYYSDFYGIELTDAMLDTLYNPPPESAMAT